MFLTKQETRGEERDALRALNAQPNVSLRDLGLCLLP